MDQKTYRQLDAVEIARLVNAGDIDPGDVTEAALVAAAEVNPAINAIVLLDEQQARQQASRVDRTAPLAGVPILIKDNNLFVEGWPTTFGSKFYEGAPPQPESSFIQRLRASGAVVLGKTNTPEFASDWTTEPTWRGPTRNPWNLRPFSRWFEWRFCRGCSCWHRARRAWQRQRGVHSGPISVVWHLRAEADSRTGARRTGVSRIGGRAGLRTRSSQIRTRQRGVPRLPGGPGAGWSIPGGAGGSILSRQHRASAGATSGRFGHTASGWQRR